MTCFEASTNLADASILRAEGDPTVNVPHPGWATDSQEVGRFLAVADRRAVRWLCKLSHDIARWQIMPAGEKSRRAAPVPA